ncbi:MAG: multicopper oxidase domain-containing protein [Ginsengibacter sp.]
MKKLFYLMLSFLFLQTVAKSQNNLYIPPVLNGPVYNLTMANGNYQFNAGINSATKGFNGNVLGPTLIMQSGQQVHMNVHNLLGEETTVHWHGFHVEPENDGGPHTIIDPNTTWTPSFTVLEKAGTYWYHPHAHTLTAKQVLQGLAGMIIVRDAEEAALNLPRTYGVDDFPLIIQTKAIDATGEIQFTGSEPNPDTNLMVNVTKYARLNVPQQMVRFRILNASNQRVFNLGLSNNGVFYQIATDGGLKNTRGTIQRLQLAPGERAEIVVPFSNYGLGATVLLKSYANELPAGTWGAAAAWINHTNSTPSYSPNYMNGTAFTVLKFTVVAATANAVTTVPPATLGTDIPIPAAQATVTRNKYLFSGGGLTVATGSGVKISNTSSYINATNFDETIIDDVIPIDQTEIWVLHGAADQYHPFHIHDVQFYILDRKDSLGNIIPLTSNEIGRKDVVYVGPKQTVRFVTQFKDFWGDVPYMYHCHITVHEDMGMMKQFVVNKYFYVNKNYVGSIENGSVLFPFKTLGKAVIFATDGTTIYFRSGGIHEEITSTPILIQKKITLKVSNGPVIIQ